MSNVMTVPPGSVKVRMYKPGFGDCFLIAFPGNDGNPAYVLIDCGVHHQDKDNKKKIKRMAQSILEATGGRLELLVVTHEHTDHIDGFKLAQDDFNSISVENVWMGWTEDYADPRVKDLDQAFRLHVEALKTARDELKSSQAALWEKLEGILAFYAEELGVTDRMSNRETMTWLQKKGGPGLKFCVPGEILTLDRVPDVRFYVLGPPVLDKFLKRSLPAKGKNKETYITDPENLHLEDFALELIKRHSSNAGYALEVESEKRLASRYPFEDRYRVSFEDAKASGSGIYDEYFSRKSTWRQIDDRWMELAEELALKLDEHTNNTSLALAIEVGKNRQILLFPGDAQVGNWLGWQDLKWKEKRQEITIDDLLGRTVLYKVGHHGSHNATLKQLGLEKMNHPQLTALLPVDEAYAKKVPKWMHIPFPDLLTRLKEKCRNRVIRADQPIPSSRNRPYNLSKEEWKDFTQSIVEKDDYIDLTIST